MDIKSTYSKCVSGLAAVALVLGFSSIANAETSATPPVVGAQETTAQSGPSLGVEVDSRIVITAEVISVNQDTRIMTLKMPTGKIVNIPASADVPNFENIHIGDKANVTMYQSLVIYQGATGEEVRMDRGETLAHRSTDGKPGTELVRTIDVSVQIKEINKETREVTVQMPDGNQATAKADPADKGFDGLSVGDSIHVRLVQGFAIDVVAS